jgi:hypothetical protein
MSRSESPREDLLREATALVERAELLVSGYQEPIVVGFRRDGSASFFFGADPVYQFNAAGELRRAFVGGLLFKAEHRRLVALRRERTAAETALVRLDLAPDETEAFLRQTGQHLAALLSALQGGGHRLLRQIPPDTDLLPRIIACLQNLPAPLTVAAAPHAQPRRK